MAIMQFRTIEVHGRTDTVAIDMFNVRTLYILIMPGHDRPKIRSFGRDRESNTSVAFKQLKRPLLGIL